MSSKADDVKLNTMKRQLNGVTVRYTVLMQNRKFNLIRTNLVSAMFRSS